MQNSPLIPLAAFVVAIALASVTVVSLMAGVGGNPALNELQIGATAWALTLAVFGVQGVVSIVLEGQQLFVGTIEPRLDPLRASRYGVDNLLSVAIAALSVLLFILAGLTGLAIVSGQSTAVVGSAAGAGCLDLGLLLLFYKEAFIGHEAHLEPRQDGVPW